MGAEPFRYTSAGEDSGRWAGFPFRNGDIVISSRLKTGTTWVQMICALLIFQTPQLNAPIGWYSPWLDLIVRPKEEIFALLAAQQHRRFIKTHTPLDGIPIDPRATYIVVGRHPLDAAVSLYFQGENINRDRQRQLIAELTGQPVPADPEEPRKAAGEWLLDWIDSDASPHQEMDSIRGFLWHYSDAWARRSEPDIVLLHYAELSADLEGQMRQLASQLGITVPDSAWPGLIEAATFTSMRADAERITGSGHLFKSAEAFFRRGTSGAGREVLTKAELARYDRRGSRTRLRRHVALASPPVIIRRRAPRATAKGSGLSQFSYGLTGRYWTMASMPDIGQDTDLRIRIPAH